MDHARVGIAAGVSSALLARIGTRPVIVGGALLAAGGVYWLSRIRVHGSFLSDLLPGMLIVSVGLGAVFVGVTTAATVGVPADKSGLAASVFILAAAVIALRATNTRGEVRQAGADALPAPVPS